ncbi:MAG: translation initiation factor [Bacteroidaceae bacterium]|nr:translation initiation factor [Bacteroidaceae bacterium]
MSKNDWKERLNVVYSTNPDFEYVGEEIEEPDTLPKRQQKLRVRIDRRNRGGKVVTLVTGFVGDSDTCKELGKWLKGKCGVGGSVKEQEIILQGDFKLRATQLLLEEGYSQTKSC